MTDITQFFISSAMAQQAGPASSPMMSSGIVSPQLFLVFTIFAVWYFIVIRPNNKRVEDQAKMIKALQRGDRVVTSGGMYGKITKVENDNTLIVEIANGVEVKFDRSSIQSLEAKTQPVVEVEKK